MVNGGLYPSIAQSKRWNRNPIAAGSSEYDDRDGGGASLAVGSDFDDGDRAEASHSHHPFDDEREGPARPASNLRGDAKPFRSRVEASLWAEFNNSQASPESTQSIDVKSTASQPVVATRPAMRPAAGNREDTVSCTPNFSIPLWYHLRAMAACPSSAERAYMGCLTWMTKTHYAAIILMGIYRDNQRRARSATTSQDKFADDHSHEQRGYRTHTASSSPIKPTTLGWGAMKATELNGNVRARMTQKHINGNTSSQSENLPTSTANGATHRQNIQVGPPIASTTNHNLWGSPVMDIRSSPDKTDPVTKAHAGDTHQANGVRYDVQAPAFTPPSSSFANINIGVNGNTQMGQVKLGATYQKSQQQGIANSSAPAVGSTRVSPPPGFGHFYQYLQNGELADDNNSMATLNAVQLPTTRSGAGSQQQHDDSFARHSLRNETDLIRQYPQYRHSPIGTNTHSLNGKAEQVRSRPFSPMHGVIGTQDRQQGHANGNAGPSNNQQDSPTLAVGRQLPQNQGGANSMAYSSEQQKRHVQGNQFAQAMSSLPLNLPSPHYQEMDNGMRVLPANRRPHQELKAQNGSSGLVNGYAYGLTSSVSDGSMAQYYPQQQPSPPMDLIRVDEQLGAKKGTVGPLAFGTPTKEIMANRSEMLQVLTKNGKPSLKYLLDTKFLPFTETYKFASPSEDNGVIIIQNVSPNARRTSSPAILSRSFARNSFIVTNSALHETRSRTRRRAVRSSPSWAGNPRSSTTVKSPSTSSWTESRARLRMRIASFRVSTQPLNSSRDSRRARRTAGSDVSAIASSTSSCLRRQA